MSTASWKVVLFIVVVFLLGGIVWIYNLKLDNDEKKFETLGINALTDAVKKELAKPLAAKNKKGSAFLVQSYDLEVKFTVYKTKGPGSIAFNVVQRDPDEPAPGALVQTVRLHMIVASDTFKKPVFVVKH